LELDVIRLIDTTCITPSPSEVVIPGDFAKLLQLVDFRGCIQTVDARCVFNVLIRWLIISSTPAMGKHSVFEEGINSDLHFLLRGPENLCFDFVVARGLLKKGIELPRSTKLA
jgi:hypothetical protein